MFSFVLAVGMTLFCFGGIYILFGGGRIYRRTERRVSRRVKVGLYVEFERVLLFAVRWLGDIFLRG